MTSCIGSLVDGVVIGQFPGLDSMEAFGLVSPVVLLFSLIGSVIAAGVRNRFAMKISSGDLAGARGVFTLSVVIGTGLSVFLMILIFVFADPVCVLLGATGNTVTFGFRPNRHNTIDMRILKKGDEYIVRIRDDCEIFDPVKQLQLYDRNDLMHHMGLRLVIGTAVDVQYTTILKLNNLVLRV